MKRFVSIGCLCLVAIFMLGVSNSLGAPEGKIALYTSVPQPIADKIQADFTAKYPAINLVIFRAGTSAVVAKLMTEKAAGSIMADLIWVAEPSTYEDFKDQDLLLKFTPEEAQAVPAQMKDPDGYYYAGRLMNMIIGYHAGIPSPPKGWKDLLNPAFKGKAGFPTPLNSGAAEATVRSLADIYGWKFFEEFKANGGKQVKNNSSARDMLSTGELSVGVLLDYMVRGAKKKGSPIDYIWPEDGAVFIPSPIGILKSSKNPDAAVAFVNYLISKEGQQTLVKKGNFYPVRADVKSPANAPGLDTIKTLPTNWKSVRENRQETKDKWSALFGKK
jgi:iron(III) transport system substrate-binding protein